MPATSRFRVQGSGFRVQGSVFRVQGSGFRVQGPGFRVQGCTWVESLPPKGAEARARNPIHETAQHRRRIAHQMGRGSAGGGEEGEEEECEQRQHQRVHLVERLIS